MLLESLRIAAAAHGRLMSWQSEGGDRHSRITVRFTPNSSVDTDPLFPCLRVRTVNRWSYKDRPLARRSATSLKPLSAMICRSLVRGGRAAARIRTVGCAGNCCPAGTPEAFPTHQAIIDWKLKISPSKDSAGALGLDQLTLFFMGLGMKRPGF